MSTSFYVFFPYTWCGKLLCFGDSLDDNSTVSAFHRRRARRLDRRTDRETQSSSEPCLHVFSSDSTRPDAIPTVTTNALQGAELSPLVTCPNPNSDVHTEMHPVVPRPNYFPALRFTRHLEAKHAVPVPLDSFCPVWRPAAKIWMDMKQSRDPACPGGLLWHRISKAPLYGDRGRAPSCPGRRRPVVSKSTTRWTLSDEGSFLCCAMGMDSPSDFRERASRRPRSPWILDMLHRLSVTTST